MLKCYAIMQKCNVALSLYCCNSCNGHVDSFFKHPSAYWTILPYRRVTSTNPEPTTVRGHCYQSEICRRITVTLLLPFYRAITVSSDNYSYCAKAIIVRSDNDFYEPRAIAIRSKNFSPQC